MSHYILQNAVMINIGWSGTCSGHAFGGLQYANHLSGLQDYQGTELNITILENQLVGARALRDLSRQRLNSLNQRAVHGLLSDSDYGDDAPLYGQWGYTRRSDRDSGLVRPSGESPTV